MTRRPSGSVLHCARCDVPVEDGTDVCTNRPAYRPGTVATVCGSRAFYRGRPPQRSIMPPAMDEEPDEDDELVPARKSRRGRGPD